MVKDEFTPDDLLREAFDIMKENRLETKACRFLSYKGGCNHVGDEDGINGCIAFLLGQLVKKLERY